MCLKRYGCVGVRVKDKCADRVWRIPEGVETMCVTPPERCCAAMGGRRTVSEGGLDTVGRCRGGVLIPSDGVSGRLDTVGRCHGGVLIPSDGVTEGS